MTSLNCHCSSSLLIKNKKLFLHDITLLLYRDRTTQEESTLGGWGGRLEGGEINRCYLFIFSNEVY